MAQDNARRFEHTLAWWHVARACPGQVLLLRYEDLCADTRAQVARVAGLLGVQPDGAALDAVVRASSFEAMRQRHEATDGAASRAMRHEGEAGHFRRGSPGGWREKFTPEQSRRFDAALRERLGGSGLEEDFFPVTTGVAR
mmetsp:Transcript_12006/g.35350  ORF Transcript_12006/g.35350 Transcript_12006/m.35350 type:complete len:141 (+) Transcript_12006:727-1149(+)